MNREQNDNKSRRVYNLADFCLRSMYSLYDPNNNLPMVSLLRFNLSVSLWEFTKKHITRHCFDVTTRNIQKLFILSVCDFWLYLKHAKLFEFNAIRSVLSLRLRLAFEQKTRALSVCQVFCVVECIAAFDTTCLAACNRRLAAEAQNFRKDPSSALIVMRDTIARRRKMFQLKIFCGDIITSRAESHHRQKKNHKIKIAKFVFSTWLNILCVRLSRPMWFVCLLLFSILIIIKKHGQREINECMVRRRQHM